MHKYQPRVHVIRKECGEELSPVRAVPAGEGTHTFSFPETVFTTVTAYQNQQVAQLTTLHDHIPSEKTAANTLNKQPCCQQVRLFVLYSFFRVPTDKD